LRHEYSKILRITEEIWTPILTILGMSNYRKFQVSMTNGFCLNFESAFDYEFEWILGNLSQSYEVRE